MSFTDLVSPVAFIILYFNLYFICFDKHDPVILMMTLLQGLLCHLIQSSGNPATLCDNKHCCKPIVVKMILIHAIYDSKLLFLCVKHIMLEIVVKMILIIIPLCQKYYAWILGIHYFGIHFFLLWKWKWKRLICVRLNILATKWILKEPCCIQVVLESGMFSRRTSLTSYCLRCNCRLCIIGFRNSNVCVSLYIHVVSPVLSCTPHGSSNTFVPDVSCLALWSDLLLNRSAIDVYSLISMTCDGPGELNVLYTLTYIPGRKWLKHIDWLLNIPWLVISGIISWVLNVTTTYFLISNRKST